MKDLVINLIFVFECFETFFSSGYLRPSRELLEYYRKKIGEYDVEREEIFKRLDSLKGTMDDQHKLQWELRQKDDEIAELQKAISDMQVFLFKEREQVLKLYAENDRLKVFYFFNFFGGWGKGGVGFNSAFF